MNRENLEVEAGAQDLRILVDEGSQARAQLNLLHAGGHDVVAIGEFAKNGADAFTRTITALFQGDTLRMNSRRCESTAPG